MMRKILVSVLLIIFSLISTQPVVAEKVVENTIVSDQIEVRTLDKEAKILADYLATHNSPLQYHAQDFIDAAKEYDLNWRLMAAISGVESTFGKNIPGGYNAWGWGVYGNQAIYFASWKEGIFTVAKGLRENYLDKGLTDPYSINRVYAASPYWGEKVTYFMNDIDKFAQKYQAEAEPMAVSGKLAFR